MSCYSKHPNVLGVECWHGPGHAGDHGKEGRRWPNLDDARVKLLDEAATQLGGYASLGEWPEDDAKAWDLCKRIREALEAGR